MMPPPTRKKDEDGWGDNEFEVESIVDFTKIENEEYFLVKWVGWSHRHNTWEPRAHLNCSEEIEQFKATYHNRKRPNSCVDAHQVTDSKRQCVEQLTDTILKHDPSLTAADVLRACKELYGSDAKTVLSVLEPFSRKPRLPLGNISNKRSKAHRLHMQAVRSAVKEWEKHINKINTDPAPILVENNVDGEAPPMQFKYVNDYVAGEGVIVNNTPVIGCDCTNCIREKSMCCGSNAGFEFAYYQNRRLRVPPGTPIYECNSRCKCGPECPNRVVQLGRKHRICIFRTKNGRGWGVKALQKIKKGSFVMEYIGELITTEEAERRGQNYDANGMTYLFDLDYQERDCQFTVDAGVYGNASHFINHSCDPNLIVYGVWINNLDTRLPRIALFALRDIEKGEELTFDYMMHADENETSSVTTQPSPVKAAHDPNRTNAPCQDVPDIPADPTPVSLVTPDRDAADRQQVVKVCSSGSEGDVSVDCSAASDDRQFVAPAPPPPPEGADCAESVGYASGSSSVLSASNADQNDDDDDDDVIVFKSTAAAVEPQADLNTPMRRTANSVAHNSSKYRMRCLCGSAKCRGFLY